MKEIKLFCIPWAGGSATLLADSIELIPVELAGRGLRYASPPYGTMDEAIEDVYNTVREHLEDPLPYAFFGHSMGSVIAYELSHRIRRLDGKEPLHLFVSGRWAPNIIKQNSINYDMSRDDLKEEMLRLEGTQEDLFENDRLMDAFIPVLKSDLMILEKYQYHAKEVKLSTGITAMTGIRDASITHRELLEWQKHTEGEFKLCKFGGGHFFINDSREAVLKCINTKLAECLPTDEERNRKN
jgi:medium-chain acyl-[acyl-carrier-protein] hydrolase